MIGTNGGFAVEFFLQNLLHLGFTASFFMLAVFALRLLLKRAPKWITCLLWALLAVRLLCPFSVESAVSLVPNGETVTQSVAMQGIAQPTVETVASPLSAVNLVFGIWAGGAAILFLYAAVSYIRLYLRLRVHIQDSGNVYLCDGLKSPFIFGIFKPRIFLPSDITADRKTYILQHEFAHLARGDQFWKPLGFAILTVYWFHPLVWVSYILFCRDIELACDERVARRLSLADKKAYSETLLLCSVRPKSVAACPLSFAEVGVKARVKSVLRYKKPLVSVVVLSCIAVLAVAVCFLTEPKAETAPVAENTAESVAEATVPVPEPVTESNTELVTESAVVSVDETVTTPVEEVSVDVSVDNEQEQIVVKTNYTPQSYYLDSNPGYYEHQIDDPNAKITLDSYVACRKNADNPKVIVPMVPAGWTQNTTEVAEPEIA